MKVPAESLVWEEDMIRKVRLDHALLGQNLFFFFL